MYRGNGAFLFSGVWSLDNFKNFFYSQVGSQFGIPSWFIGMALLITPFFGFETVPQMVERGTPDQIQQAIIGSIVSCGLVYTLFFFGLGGMPVQSLVEEGGAAVNGFLAITMMEQLGGGWSIFAIIFGIAAILCAIGTCLLGFWAVYSSSDVCYGREQLSSKGIYEIKQPSAAGASEYFIADHIFDLFTFTERYHIYE